jgi:eukaryotic translation initiation factor 2C
MIGRANVTILGSTPSRTAQDADADHNGNPRSGTVVDRGVTAVYHSDFFLQGEDQNLICLLLSAKYRLHIFTAHGGLQGTTKPTHYFVVHDEIGL